MSTSGSVRATICTPGKFCATVYGDTARIINAIAIAIVLFIAMAVAIRAIS